MYLLPWRGSCDTTDTRTKDQAKITWLTATIDRKYSTTSLQQYVQKMNLPPFKFHSQHISWLSLRKLGWAKARLPLQPGCVGQSHMPPFTTHLCWATSHDCLYNPDVLSSHKTLPLQPSCVEQSHMTAITLYSTLPNLQPSCFEQNHVVPPSGLCWSKADHKLIHFKSILAQREKKCNNTFT